MEKQMGQARQKRKRVDDLGSLVSKRAAIADLLSLSHPRYIRTKLDWEKLAKDVGVGSGYLKDVVSGRRRGSVKVQSSIARHLSGGDKDKQWKIYYLLASSFEGTATIA